MGSSLGMGSVSSFFFSSPAYITELVTRLGNKPLKATKHSASKESNDPQHTLEAGFLDSARDAGFFVAADEAGLADAREAGLVDAAREAGFTEPAREAFDTGFVVVAAAFDAGLVAEALETGFEAGLAYRRVKVSELPYRYLLQMKSARLTLLDGGGFSPSAVSAPLVAGSSASRSVTVRFLPLVDLGFSATSLFSFSSSDLAFFTLGFTGAFLGAASALGRSLIRAERRGSADSVTADLRGIFPNEK